MIKEMLKKDWEREQVGISKINNGLLGIGSNLSSSFEMNTNIKLAIFFK